MKKPHHNSRKFHLKELARAEELLKDARLMIEAVEGWVKTKPDNATLLGWK